MQGLSSTYNRVQTPYHAIAISNTPVLSPVPHKFSNADPDIDPQAANYARSIILSNHGTKKANFDSDPDNRTTNLAPFSDQCDDSSFALPVLLSDAECSQDINGKFNKEQLMQICPSDYRQAPQGSSTGQNDGVFYETGPQAPTIPRRVPGVTKLGKLGRDPSIYLYPQRQVPVCSRYDVAVLMGSTYVLTAWGPCKPSFFPHLAISSRENTSIRDLDLIDSIQ